jgi:hypothetical protein
VPSKNSRFSFRGFFFLCLLVEGLEADVAHEVIGEAVGRVGLHGRLEVAAETNGSILFRTILIAKPIR